ncbi:MAG: type VI secretion system baseplate subunit TssF [Pseudomonadaceae bacterium]|nr:MAG: type VI secretion system baseplate subunit TssF [Pseudomonadaceae bacterium]
MSFNHYYQSELTALRESGKLFAERNPALAPFLGQSGRDPDVERLLEGFAFLTGRLRQKLDDELPELTHSLMHLLWPNYMRPVPAFSTLQFSPLRKVGPAQRIARDTPVESAPVEGVPCRFRTAYATELQALDIKSVDYAIKGVGGLLNIRLMLTADGHIDELQLQRLRLHFAGERYISQMLYLLALRRTDSVEVVLLDRDGKPLNPDNGQCAIRLAPGVIKPVGFDDDQALIPYPLNTFVGYRHLQEYFAFQEKFLYVDVTGLEALLQLPEEQLKQAHGIALRLHIEQAGKQNIRPGKDNIRLHCTPVVNLFQHDATPIRLDGRQDQYLLRPAEHQPHQCGVFSIDRVTGWKPGGMGYEEYVAFESFQHDANIELPGGRPYYSLRQQPSLLGDGLDTYLSFTTRSLAAHETLSIELTCTNQNLPRQLSLGDIRFPSEDTPQWLTFRNISPVTASYAPPLHQDYLWRLISNMSLNYLSLSSVEALKAILETYDLPRHVDQHAAQVSKRLLAGLKAVSNRPVDRLDRGLPVRGICTELTIDPEGYLGEGDMFLFASVLNEFFALYASLNSYHQLRVTSTQGEVYQWTPRMGLQPLL